MKSTIETRRGLSSFEETLKRFEGYGIEAQQKRTEIEKWLATKPQSIVCHVHQIILPIDFDESSRVSQRDKCNTLVYRECKLCAEDEERRILNAHWTTRGVPQKLIGATLDTLAYDSPKDQKNLEWCRKFQRRPEGFLVLLGWFGAGKTHAASAILQSAESGHFFKHSTLCELHRKRYDDHTLPDVKTIAIRSKLLVLDEVGVSAGGNDLQALLSDILDARYSSYLPTILTANYDNEHNQSYENFKASIGGRIVDRLKESAFAVLKFEQRSVRDRMNQQYFSKE